MSTIGLEDGVKVFVSMLGVTMVSVTGDKGEERMTFAAADGSQWMFHYEPECCAHCSIEDICGDLNDLIGSPIIEAEEISGVAESPGSADSYTWTFYRYATAKGVVTVRWLGESNGFYSESVTYTQSRMRSL